MEIYLWRYVGGLNMALIEIEDEIIEIINKENKEDFIYDFLKIYDIPNSTITRLKNGTNNLSKIPGKYI